MSSTAIACPNHSIAPVPRGERRRREIAAVAEQVFFDNGFTDTTMQTIAARAGASKETLYRHFGSKEELFAEIVETRARGFLGGLDAGDRPDSFAEALHETGTLIMEGMFGHSAVGLGRIVVAESPRNPELGRIFLEEGPYRVRRHLTDFLEAARRRGEIACADPQLAATQFLGLLIAPFHVERLVLHPFPALSPEQVAGHVSEAVTMFLARYAKA